MIIQLQYMKRTAKQKQFLKLINNWLTGKATKWESSIVEHYFDLFAEEHEILDTLGKNELREIHNRMKTIIDGNIQKKGRIVIIARLKYWSAAAAVLLISGASLYLYHKDSLPLNRNSNIVKLESDIAPGSNRAVLTLSDGTRLILGDSTKEKLAVQQGATIDQTGQGGVVYRPTSLSEGKLTYNTISTPNGGQYQVKLPDGTKVWLNAGSSLTYPVVFAKNERRVELVGEAYFEVAKNKQKPFLVKGPEQIITVLGTHFNVNSYADEGIVKTTLLEGIVSVENVAGKYSTVIKPGQQTILNKNLNYPFITVTNVDSEESVAWKNGYFLFDQESLKSILRKVSRWYDVEIVYPDNYQDKLFFNGTLSKYNNVSKVLKKLELTGSVHFSVEGRRIMVKQ